MAVHDHMLQVCSRLFRQKVSNPIPLKRLGIINVEEFKQHGYLVVDNFITKEVASSIREEALRIKQKGAQELSSLPLGLLITFCVFVCLTLTCWIHHGCGSYQCRLMCCIQQDSSLLFVIAAS